jgi:hypothetical protein
VPTVLRERGFRFYFYALEGNEPPHVHVDRGSGTLKLWLHDLSIESVESLKAAEVSEALKIARTYHRLLLNSWYEFAGRKN